MSDTPPRSPLDLLERFGTDEAHLGAGTRLVEIHTMGGLLSLLWQGDPTAESVVVCCAGANGGFLGPMGGFFVALGRRLADLGIATVAVDYRRPDKPDRCLLDVAATADLAMRQGARRFVFVGHSFGGSVAIQAGIALAGFAAGVVTLATQSGGCEGAAALSPTPLLLVHGGADQMLPPESSAMVRSLAGYGELRFLDGADHGLGSHRDELLELLGSWIPDRFADQAAGDDPVA